MLAGSLGSRCAADPHPHLPSFIYALPARQRHQQPPRTEPPPSPATRTLQLNSANPIPSPRPHFQTSRRQNPDTRAARVEWPHLRVRSRTRRQRTSEPLHLQLYNSEVPLRRAVRPRPRAAGVNARQWLGRIWRGLECTRARYNAAAGGSPSSSSPCLSRRAPEQARVYSPRSIQRRTKRLRHRVRLNRSPRSKTEGRGLRTTPYGIQAQEPGVRLVYQPHIRRRKTIVPGVIWSDTSARVQEYAKSYCAR